ncbi:hypothetical protein [Phenylobacterium immobile]|uniref:hypothetical protein n=1 Tax=Phenylobacterium immobile TaxID=21 RepID=UPI000B82A1E3|nr:hypothetical protein [Phenylobacterium immobile]
MPAYRFYTLPRDPAAAPLEAMFFDDRTALLWGFRTAGQAGMEIWEGSRFVGRLHGGQIAEQGGPPPPAAYRGIAKKYGGD